MNRNGHTNVSLFVGKEVEHTSAHGLNTLFVIGLQPIDLLIKTQLDFNCPHIYFGANQSFPKLDTNDAEEWKKWETMINVFLPDYLCTLDIDVSCVEGLIESGLTEHHNFIPMVSVKLPYIQQLGYNALIKLDDKDFAATNPGVWCHRVHELQNRQVFTDWSKYTKDEIVK